MNIGNLETRNNLVLAPMAGVTDLPFRLVAVDHGCGLVVSEMVSAKGLVMGGGRTRDLLSSSPAERPLAVQLFGSEPESMAEAAAVVEEAGADILDINMGCPVKKVVGGGAGAALLRDLRRIEKILKGVRKRVTIPLTIKIRAGWDHSSINALEVLAVAEEQGVDAIIVHPRTRSQGFTGRADWSLIGRIKERAGIPVIGNGDVRSPEDAVRMFEETGCDGVMIGRGALGNPWIFGQILSLGKGTAYSHPTAGARRETVLRHLDLVIDRYGAERGVKVFRKHLSWYARGMEGAASFRRLVNGTVSPAEMRKMIEDFFAPESEERNRRAAAAAVSHAAGLI